MTTRTKAAPWPFSVPEKALKGPLGRELRAFYEHNHYPSEREEFDDVLEYNQAGKLLKAAYKHSADGLLGLILASTGAHLEGHLFDGRSATSLGDLCGSLNLQRNQLQFPDVDLKVLIEQVAPMILGKAPGRKSLVEDWLDHGQARKQMINDMVDHAGRSFYSSGQSSSSDLIVYSAMAHFCGLDMPHSSAHSLPAGAIQSLVDLSLPFEDRQAGLVAFCQQEIPWHFDRLMPKNLVVSPYVFALVRVIAPMALLFGHDVVAVAEAVRKTLDFIFRQIANDQESFKIGAPEAYDAGMKTTLMSLLWNHPEHWGRFSLVAADLLGIDYKHMLKDYGERRQTAGGYLMDLAFIPRDGTDGTFAKCALKALGARHGLFNPKHIVRRWGTCNIAWVSGVKDFVPAADEINQMMPAGIWHQALEGTRVSALFGEDAARHAVIDYLESGGNANLQRARSSLDAFPALVDSLLAVVTKRSVAARLATLTQLTPGQIERLPEHLHETILAAELGL